MANKTKLVELYNLGRSDAECRLEEMKKFLEG